MHGRMHNWRLGAVAVAATALVVGAPANAGAQVAGAPGVVGQWTEPFEEGGSGTPRCVAADDGSGFVICKPTAQAAAVLADGRVFYFNGLESQENSQGPTVPSLSPSSRNSQARVLDLRTGTPLWVVPEQPRADQDNPNIEEGHESYDDPLGALGVPGRPGDGFVGSTWGELGGPEHAPTSPPDDTADNDGDLFCADLTLLPDGRLLIAGGTDWYNEPALLDRNDEDPADVGVVELEGLRNTNLFDATTDSFTAGGPMKYGRWYPHLVIGADGLARVFSGVTQLITDTQGSQVRRSETFDPTSGTWSENYVGPESENSLPLVPRIVLTPDGKFFYTGVGQMWGPFGEAVDEATYALQQSFDPKTRTWEVKGLAPLGARSGAAVVPLQMQAPFEQMDILAFGGTLGPPPGSWFPANPLTTITTVDASGNVANRVGANLNHARWYPSGVLLPDGQVLAVGGGDKDHVVDPGTEVAVKVPELYDPASGTWTEVAEQTRDRTYHNSALLLPDMRVLLGGHAPLASHYGGANSDQGGGFANNDNDPSFEVWSPPYLFRGARPEITRAQAGIAYGEKFKVGTHQADDIESVVILRVPSPEHINDSDQRSLSLDFKLSGAADTLEVTAPPSGNAAPPGHYYLVVNKATPQGPVPSVARIITVGVGTDLGESAQPFNYDAPAPAFGSATTPEDSSQAAAMGQRASEAAKSAPAPLSGPAGAAAEAVSDLDHEPSGTTAADAYPTTPDTPAAAGAEAYLRGPGIPAAAEAYRQAPDTQAPRPEGPLPALPGAVLGVAGTAGLSARRWPGGRHGKRGRPGLADSRRTVGTVH